jgi:hypothetical protein
VGAKTVTNVSHTRVILHEANIRNAFDAMRWMENVDQKFGHFFGQLPRPDYVGSHPDSKPLDVQDRAWMIEIKSRDADPHNKLLDFVEGGPLSFREFISLQLVGHFKTVLRRANRQLQSGRDVLNPSAKGALIYINRGFQSLRREAAASIIFDIVRSPDSRFGAIDLVVYIQEGFDGDPNPERRRVELFKIWSRDPNEWDSRYANFLVDFVLGSIVTFAGKPSPEPSSVRVVRDGRVVQLTDGELENLLAESNGSKE